MEMCADCAAGIIPDYYTEEDYPSIRCRLWGSLLEPHDPACASGKLLSACHRQRDRAIKAESELTNVWHDLRMAQRRIEQLEEELKNVPERW